MIPRLKCWSKYLVVLLVGAVSILLVFLLSRKSRARISEVQDIARSISQSLGAANQQAVLEIQAARMRDERLRERIRQVSRMKDPKARRERLLALYHEVSK